MYGTGATDPAAARDTTSSQDDWHAMEKDELAQALQKRKLPEWDKLTTHKIKKLLRERDLPTRSNRKAMMIKRLVDHTLSPSDDARPLSKSKPKLPYDMGNSIKGIETEKCFH